MVTLYSDLTLHTVAPTNMIDHAVGPGERRKSSKICIMDVNAVLGKLRSHNWSRPSFRSRGLRVGEKNVEVDGHQHGCWTRSHPLQTRRERLPCQGVYRVLPLN